MARGKRDGLLIAGGGLAGSLAALAMARRRPEIPILLVEEGETFGGKSPLLVFDQDIDDRDRWLADPLVRARWPGYYVAFPGNSRKLKAPCGLILPEDLDRHVRETLSPDQYRLGTKIVAVRDNELILQGGEKIRADGAVDARGAANLSMLDLGWENYAGHDFVFAGPHGVDRPVLVDAVSGRSQANGYFRCVPLTPDRMVVEEVTLSEIAGLDEQGSAARIGDYLAERGWEVKESRAVAAGGHPRPFGGDFGAFWRVGGARVAKLGLRGGFFHPATGHSLPDALRTATMLAEQRDLAGAGLHDLFEAEAANLWRQRDLYRGSNRILFETPVAERLAMLDRLYRLSPGVLARFHAGRLNFFDRSRVIRAKLAVPGRG